MSKYTAQFIKIEGLDETRVGNLKQLVATTRDAAEDEALDLPRPEGANFIKLYLDQQFQPPKIGFAL